MILQHPKARMSHILDMDVSFLLYLGTEDWTCNMSFFQTSSLRHPILGDANIVNIAGIIEQNQL